MSLLITRQEASLYATNQVKTFVRAHRKVYYPKASKVPLVLDKESPSPFAVQVIGVKEMTLGDIDESKAKECGFRGRDEFMLHWEKLYGKNGLHPSGLGHFRATTKIVIYRVRRTDFIHKRLRFE